jgi:ubiquinone/menaquinone biosynthesis C-methylase UbiE
LSQTRVDDGMAYSEDPYRDIAEFYDLEHDLFTDDLPLIRHFVETVGDPVLELGCGSGRILAALADSGMRLTGVDSSPAMLDRCRARFADAITRPTLVQSDMANTNLPGNSFGVVILGLNSLMHATSSSTQRSVLKEAFRLIDPRGMLFIDLANVHAGAFDFPDHQVVAEGAWRRADGSSVAKYSSRRLHRAEQQIHTRLWYDEIDRKGELRRTETEYDLRLVYRSELLLMLEVAGFVEWQVYGSYELEPFTDLSPRLIVTAEKSASR